MINSLLHIGNMALSYAGGRHVGLPGILGIILTFIIILSWDLILPVLDFIGLVSLADSLGLIYEGAPEMTFFRVVVAICMFLFGASIFIGIIISLIMGTVAMSENKFGRFILISLLCIVAAIILLPLVVLIGIILGILWIVSTVSTYYHKKTDPIGYAENKRLSKNFDAIDMLKFEGCKGVDDNFMTYDEAYKYLDKLPRFTEASFLIGVTHDRDIYALLPKPLIFDKMGHSGEVIAEPMDIEIKKTYSRKNVKKEVKINFHEDVYKNKNYYTKETINLESFEHLILPKGDLLLSVLKKYSESDQYLSYVKEIINIFNQRGNEVSDAMGKTEDSEEFDRFLNMFLSYRRYLDKGRLTAK